MKKIQKILAYYLDNRLPSIYIYGRKVEENSISPIKTCLEYYLDCSFLKDFGCFSSKKV